MMANSWPFVAEIVCTPCNVIDLQSFAQSVRMSSTLIELSVSIKCIG